jgi:DNA-binding XRE family transcriptional regulator
MSSHISFSFVNNASDQLKVTIRSNLSNQTITSIEKGLNSINFPTLYTGFEIGHEFRITINFKRPINDINKISDKILSIIDPKSIHLAQIINFQ